MMQSLCQRGARFDAEAATVPKFTFFNRLRRGRGEWIFGGHSEGHLAWQSFGHSCRTRLWHSAALARFGNGYSLKQGC
jgi:hypothetical protein